MSRSKAFVRLACLALVLAPIAPAASADGWLSKAMKQVQQRIAFNKANPPLACHVTYPLYSSDPRGLQVSTFCEAASNLPAGSNCVCGVYTNDGVFMWAPGSVY